MENKDMCVICGKKSIHDKEEHIDFRLGYIEGTGQLCLDCYGRIYDLKPKLQGMEKLIKLTKESGEA